MTKRIANKPRPTHGEPTTRTRAGVKQFRMGCTRCGTVRWLPLEDIALPHCHFGVFGFLLTRKPALV